MKSFKLMSFVIAAAFLAACGGAPNTNQPANAANAANTAAAPAVQTLAVVERPQKLKDMMAARGEQDAAAPTLKIIEPRSDAAVASSTVKVKLDISGDLKGYKPHMDMETKMGNHIHVILDNQPYEAYYNLEQEFELRNVSDGEHTLRVFPSRPWHESYKNAGAFQMVKFTVKNGGADTTKPATANGNTMSTNANADAKPTPEGKEMKESKAGAVDATKPLLTFSRPKGEYKGADADAIMIDFWLANAKLKDDGGEYRVRYSVDGGEAKFIDKWAPIWLSGWIAGKHTIKLELVDAAGNVVDNGGYNSTTREITIVK
ncbi:MAG: hypothetical protein KA746_16155 [Pyrinomonadaceae bacterium]|nr:hypothetical protein [Pyrinomonadaceae bacterium]MBP6214257.1 hypothetical protein [Pyrinomonadaceae bacterium]